MKDLTLKPNVRTLPVMARVNIASCRHNFYVEGKKAEAIKAIFMQLGIELCKGQEEYINSSFVFEANKPIKREAVVRACSGQYKEYALCIFNNVLSIRPRINEYIVEEVEERKQFVILLSNGDFERDFSTFNSREDAETWLNEFGHNYDAAQIIEVNEKVVLGLVINPSI